MIFAMTARPEVGRLPAHRKMLQIGLEPHSSSSLNPPPDLRLLTRFLACRLICRRASDRRFRPGFIFFRLFGFFRFARLKAAVDLQEGTSAGATDEGVEENEEGGDEQEGPEVTDIETIAGTGEDVDAIGVGGGVELGVVEAADNQRVDGFPARQTGGDTAPVFAAIVAAKRANAGADVGGGAVGAAEIGQHGVDMDGLQRFLTGRPVRAAILREENAVIAGGVNQPAETTGHVSWLNCIDAEAGWQAVVESAPACRPVIRAIDALSRSRPELVRDAIKRQSINSDVRGQTNAGSRPGCAAVVTDKDAVLRCSGIDAVGSFRREGERGIRIGRQVAGSRANLA